MSTKLKKLILCGCGCGTELFNFDKRGRKRMFIRGHSNKGKQHSEQTRQKMRENHADVSGEKNHFWKGGITSLHNLIRSLEESINWRNEIFKRDKYICQECGKTNCILEPHHIKRFSIILNEFLIEYSQFSPIEDKETLVRLSLSWKLFWDITNGKTLCKECHNKTKGGIQGRKCIFKKESILSAKERCRKLGLSQKNIPKTQEHKDKVSLGLKNYYKNNPDAIIKSRIKFKNIVLTCKRDSSGKFITQIS